MDPDASAEFNTTMAAAESPRPSLLACTCFDPLCERGVEAAFSVANGAFGVRASLEEGSPASHPLVIVAGVYVPTPLPASQTLLAVDDPSSLSLSLDGQLIQVSLVETLEHRRALDVGHAEMVREWSFRDARGRAWRLESLRAACAADPSAYLHRFSLAPQGDATARASLVVAGAPVLSERDRGDPDGVEAVLLSAAEAPPLGAIRTERRLHGRWALQGHTVEAEVTPSAPLVIESVSRIGGGGPPGATASFEALLAAHRRVWAERWADADVVVEGDDALQDAVRFALYHLLSVAAVDDGRTSIGARGLSGEAYHGHVFWDTEIFMLPALTFAHPAAARSCLLYRYRTLDAARERARSLGFAGALYPWESTDTGQDRTPSLVLLPDGSTLRIFTGEQEHHISADVPYAVMRYWRATGDDEFMLRYGAEIVIECARFWYSRVTPTDDTYAIRKVIGSDEYHIAVDNDAYTNAMASWTLRVASSLADELAAIDAHAARALLDRLAVRPDESADWSAAAARIGRSSFLEPRVFEQFDGFFGLRPVDVPSYRRAGIPLDVALGYEAIQGIRAVKQADVLMTAALIPEIWSEDALRANFDFYEPITAHTSSLSPPVHALLAAWLRDGERYRAYLTETMNIDLGDFRGAAGGVHLGAQGGLWQAVVFGLAGFKFSRDGVAFDPFLPPPLQALSFTLRWRGRRLRVRIDAARTLAIEVEGEAAMVRVNRLRRLVDGSALFTFDPALTYWSGHDSGGAHVP